jgi:parallel beta-helix repeat protein
MVLFIVFLVNFLFFIACDGLYPKPEPVTYVITALADNNGSIEPEGEIVVNEGQDQTFTIIPDAGYKIDNVLINGESIGVVEAYTFTNVDKKYTIEVVFNRKYSAPATPSAPTYYTISASSEIGGSIEPEGEITVLQGESKKFIIIPDVGFIISDVVVDDLSVGAISEYTFTDISRNHTIAASFTQKQFTITSSAEDGGTISPLGETVVNWGENKSFDITTNDGYLISEVKVDGTLLEDFNPTETYNYRFNDIQANHTIKASFIKKFTIKASVGDNGSIQPEGEITVLQGESKKFIIIPATCYQIEKIIINGVEIAETESPYIITNIQQHYSIEVSFTLSDTKIGRYNQEWELQGNYTKIQNAIDDAIIGDTIIVCPGIYTENLLFDDKNITVRSANPEDPNIVTTTIIDGGIDKDEIKDGSVVNFTNGDTSTLEGFTIQNGNAEYGGGIYVFSSSPSILGNTIKSNKVTGLFSCGGAIYANNSTPSIVNNNITFNTASDYCGGGIYLENCMLIGTDKKIFNNTISNNEAKYGGGIILLNSSAEISENLILNNSATYGGGNYIANNSNVLMKNNTITENIASTYDGGGIFVKNSSLVMNKNDLNYNKAESNRGGGIYIENGNDISIKSNTVQYNEADFGGGIYITQSSPVISENTIQYNTAKSYGGGIFVNSNGALLPEIERPLGWGILGDQDYREDIPVKEGDNGDLIPSMEDEYDIGGNIFQANEHGDPLGYTEGAHVYFQ